MIVFRRISLVSFFQWLKHLNSLQQFLFGSLFATCQIPCSASQSSGKYCLHCRRTSPFTAVVPVHQALNTIENETPSLPSPQACASSAASLLLLFVSAACRLTSRIRGSPPCPLRIAMLPLSIPVSRLQPTGQSPFRTTVGPPHASQSSSAP